MILKSDVIEHIRRDPKLDESLRAAALQLAEHLRDNPMLLNNTSWFIARNPNRTPEDYGRALRYVEAACRLDPQESTYVNTLGVARYRAGRYQDALADLNRSLTLNAAQVRRPDPGRPGVPRHGPASPRAGRGRPDDPGPAPRRDESAALVVRRRVRDGFR